MALALSTQLGPTLTTRSLLYPGHRLPGVQVVTVPGHSGFHVLSPMILTPQPPTPRPGEEAQESLPWAQRTLSFFW